MRFLPFTSCAAVNAFYLACDLIHGLFLVLTNDYLDSLGTRKHGMAAGGTT